jgi:hypothetical protein
MNSYTFITDESIEKCIEYSSNPELLRAMIPRLSIKISNPTVVKSKLGNEKKLKSLHVDVSVNGYEFDFWGSHNDAVGFGSSQIGDWRDMKKTIKTRKEIANGLLYSVLCSVKADYYLDQYDPEDIGMNSDSIKDMAKFNEFKLHARALRSALKLTGEELESLPD